MVSILKKAANYKRIPTLRYEGEAHLSDPFTPPPSVLTPPPERTDKKPDDMWNYFYSFFKPSIMMIPYYRFPVIKNGSYTRINSLQSILFTIYSYS